MVGADLIEGQGLDRVGAWIKLLCSLSAGLLWEAVYCHSQAETLLSTTLILQHLLPSGTGGAQTMGTWGKWRQ